MALMKGVSNIHIAPGFTLDKYAAVGSLYSSL